MNRVVQWSVTLGVWWALLVDALGNYAGQDRPPCWVPVIAGIVTVLGFVHGVAWRRLTAPI